MLLGEKEGGGAHHDTGIVYEHVDTSKGIDDGFNDSLASLLVSDVLRDEQALLASGSDELLGLFGVDLFFGQVYNGDLEEYQQ